MKKNLTKVTKIASAALAARANGTPLHKVFVADDDSPRTLPKVSGCKPVGTCVLIELLTKQEMQGSKTLFIPEEGGKNNEECQQAYVLDIGPKVPTDVGFKVGDRVMLQGIGANPVPNYRGDGARKMNLVEPHIIRAVLTEAGV